MNKAEMLRLSWRDWLSQSEARVSPWWVGLAWTVVFCLVVALGFTAFSMLLGSRAGDWRSLPDWWAWYRANVVVSLCVGFAVRGSFLVSRRAVGRERLARAWPWQRSLFYLVVPIIGVSIGWPLGMLWGMGVDVRVFFSFERPQLLLATVFIALLITAVFQQFFWSRARQIRAENEASEARLRLLQAQIEPHFLFNTLANVTSLMDSDPPRARLMLESFVDYLRASLSGLGGAMHTLGEEIDLVEAYLRIVKIRMDDRLEVSVDVPATLRGLPLPALTLQPLVENAIVHGLEPRIAGGSVRVAARREGKALVITVDDDGDGLRATAAAAASPRRSGAGTALANIRQRLAHAYGGDASLRIEAQQPRGVRASLSLPLGLAA
ncbi:MAG: sensor histidine kinase [Caldimonas sp.]